MMENASWTHEGPGHTSSSFDGGGNSSNVNIIPAPDSLGPMVGIGAKLLKHNPGIEMDWTAEEQLVLEEGLRAFVSDTNVIRYAKISMQLQNKTVRDVALRSRWMTRKENSKRKKEGLRLSRKSKDKKEKVTKPTAKPSQLASQASGSQRAMPMVPVENNKGKSSKDKGKSSKVNSAVAMKMLDDNAKAFSQITANFSSLKIGDNIGLFRQTHKNLKVLLRGLENEPESMKKLPPITDKLNEDMVNAILFPPGRSGHPKQP